MLEDNCKKIAILLSTYNGEKFIEEQIDSIINQQCDFTIKLLVRDDGSSDGTIEILEKYAAEGKLEYYVGDNCGAGYSFLELLSRNRGYDFYAFCDQDDVWAHNKIISGVRQLELIARKDIPAIYFSNAEVVDKDLSEYGKKVYKQIPKIDFCTLICAGGILGCTMIFNHQLASIVQERPVQGKICLHDFFLAVLCRAVGGEIIYDPNSYIKYRQHGNNVIGISHNRFETIMNRIRGVITPRKVSIAEQAETIKTQYGDLVIHENQNWLNIVSNYKKNLYTRTRLTFSRKTNYVNNNMGIKIRLAILMGNR